jgi:diguanylate cyclase (GGDEF)-like protein
MSSKISSPPTAFQPPAFDPIDTGWRAAWALHLTRPAESFALASAALNDATITGHANDLAWSQLCRALAGYRLFGADINLLAQDFAEASSRMKALNSARGKRLASLGPAVMAMKRGRWPEALQECEKIAASFDLGAMDPDNFYLLLALSTSHVYCGNLVEGLRFGYIGLNLAQYLELAPEEVAICLPLGVALMAARDHEEANEIFSAAETVAAGIDSPMLLKTVRTNLVFVLRRIGREDTLARASALIKLILADPCAIIGGQQFAHYAAAELFVVTGDLDAAQQQRDLAYALLRLAPGQQPIDLLDDGKINFIDGMIANRRGRVSDAIDAFSKVVALLPKISAWRFSDRTKVFDELAEAFAREGRFEEAYATQKMSSQDYLANVEALNRSRRVSMRAREEMRRVQLALKQESQERRRLQNSHSQLREQMDRTSREAELLKDAAMHDQLTSLPNRRYLDGALKRILASAERESTLLSVAYLDIDHFKLINDNFGHAMGDEVLRGLGRFGPHFLRGGDVMSRIGGEEFCVVLIGCNMEAAGKRLTDLLNAFCAQQFVCDGRSLSGVTFSGGVSVFPEDGDDCDTLLKIADRRLYCAKGAGRAQVRCTD